MHIPVPQLYAQQPIIVPFQPAPSLILRLHAAGRKNPQQHSADELRAFKEPLTIFCQSKYFRRIR